MNLQATVTLYFFFLFYLLPVIQSDLNSDKKYLLEFASAVPHGRKLNWRNDSAVCTSWSGISCTNDSTRVLTLRLPGVGLKGTIPPHTLGNLDFLTTLSLRSNALNGTLPSDIFSIPSLRFIDLQNNSFLGEIPSNFSSQLELIDLSYNSLTGSIPDLQLPRLRNLGLSNNQLNGSIPILLQRFPASTFEGNPFLCGPPLEACPSKPKHTTKKRFRLLTIISIVIGVVVVFLFLMIIVLLRYMRKKDYDVGSVLKRKGGGGVGSMPKEEFENGMVSAEKNRLIFSEGCNYNFDLEDLLRASAEVLGKGTYGRTYKALMEDGTTVVVKRLKEVEIIKNDFEQFIRTVGILGNHPNVNRPRAYYHSKDEKLIIYDYFPFGNLASLLHENRYSRSRTLDWDSRLKICLGVARGITHIHIASEGKLIHGNIKSSNILLTRDLNALVSDFGLSALMGGPVIQSRAVGYHAPEVIETRKATQESDVYSFGVLLLEMLTGKAPVQSAEGDDVADLPRWVQSVIREEWTAEVFDMALMKYENVEEEMVKLLQIAMACVESSSHMRDRKSVV